MSENTKSAIHVTSYGAAEFLWNALKKVTNEYSQEELEDVFEVETIGDLVSDWDLGAFCKQFKEYDKKHEEIRVGDEVLWEKPGGYIETSIDVTIIPKEGHVGVVLFIDDECREYVILTYYDPIKCLYIDRVSMNDKTIRKTRNHFAIRSDER